MAVLDKSLLEKNPLIRKPGDFTQEVKHLAEKHPTPFLVFQPKILEQNMKVFHESCREFFPSYKICYSVKTNSYPSILTVASKKKTGFDVASDKELKLVKGFKEFKVLNGCCRTEKEFSEAIAQKALIIVDSMPELKALAKAIKQKKLAKLEIGLRLNYASTKFGFSLDQLKQAIHFCDQNALVASCLHCHPGFQSSIQKYSEFLGQVGEALKEFPDFKMIDLGGGFPGVQEMRLQNTDLKAYLKLVSEKLPVKDKTVIFEPGRYLVGNCMHLVSRIHYLKQIHSINFAVMDAGINFLPKISQNKFEYTHYSLNPKSSAEKKMYKLVGPLLFGNDELMTITEPLEEGDLVVVSNVGAYCQNLSWSISFDQPKVYELK